MWENVLWCDTQVEFFWPYCSFKKYDWHKNNTVHRPKYTIHPAVKHGGIMLFSCFSSAGTGVLDKVEGITNSSRYQSILAQNLQASAKMLQMKRNLPFNRTTTQCMLPNQQKHSFTKRRPMFLNGPTKVRT